MTEHPFTMHVSRRQVMTGAAGLTFAIALGRMDGAAAAVPASETQGKALSPWVSIAPDGTISIMSPATEMGQGSMTSLPLILAEELDADWSKVRVVPAPAIEKIYGNPGFGGMMYTNGSAKYSIDFSVPGMIYGAVVRSPVEGGTPDTFDEAKLKAVPGVISAVRLPYGIGVLAETAWGAFAGKAAVEQTIKWNRTGAGWGFDGEKGMDAFAADARNLSVPITKDWFKQGDADGQLAKAATVIEGEY